MEYSCPVIGWWTLLFILSLAYGNGWYIRSADGVQAFVQADIDVDVYLKPWKGYHNLADNKVLKLKKSLYGLHQSGLLWWKKVRDALLHIGLNQSVSDECLFYLIGDLGILFVLVYVDDILIIADNMALIERCVSKLSKQVKITYKDVEVEDFLGAEFVYGEDQLKLINTNTTAKIFTLLNWDADKVRISDTPAAVGTLELKVDEKDKVLPKRKQKLYRSVVGTLLYVATKTRPGLSNAVRSLCRYNGKARTSHWSAMERVVRYVAGTRDQGLIFKRFNNKKVNLHCFVDASFDEKAITGMVLKMGEHNTIRWSSRLQVHKVSSTMEAEVDALHETVLELVWLDEMIKEIGVDHMFKDMIIYEDNQAAKGFATNTHKSKGAKHMRVRYQRVVYEIESHKDYWKVGWVSTKGMVGDIMTKNLAKPLFRQFIPVVRGVIGVSEFLESENIKVKYD
jgi:hypothetical protein